MHRTASIFFSFKASSSWLSLCSACLRRRCVPPGRRPRREVASVRGRGYLVVIDRTKTWVSLQLVNARYPRPRSSRQLTRVARAPRCGGQRAAPQDEDARAHAGYVCGFRDGSEEIFRNRLDTLSAATQTRGRYSAAALSRGAVVGSAPETQHGARASASGPCSMPCQWVQLYPCPRARHRGHVPTLCHSPEHVEMECHTSLSRSL
jgi:hypothetical protein